MNTAEKFFRIVIATGIALGLKPKPRLECVGEYVDVWGHWIQELVDEKGDIIIRDCSVGAMTKFSV